MRLCVTVFLWVIGLIAGLGLCLYLFALIWSLRVEDRFPRIGDTIKVDGQTVHYLEAGEGRPLVLLHGASSNLRDWKATVFDQLAERYRVIAIDRPGYGWTEVASANDYKLPEQARFLQSVLDALDIENPIILGHSFGTAVGFAHLSEFPGNAAGMVALSPVARPWTGTYAWHREITVLPVIGPLFSRTILVPGYLYQRDSAIRCIFNPEEPPENYAERIAADLAYRPRSARQNALEVVYSADGLAEISMNYSRINVPITAIYDRADQIVSADFHNGFLKTEIPQTVLLEMPGTGHFAHHLAPDAVIKAVDEMAAAVTGDSVELEGAAE